MGVSQRAFAKIWGKSQPAVRKAIATGRIPVEADGTIDPEKALAALGVSTDPSQQRGSPADLRSPRVATGEAIKEQDSAGGQTTFLQARTANEVLKAQERRVRLQKLKDSLIDRGTVSSRVFDLARQERDSWLNWPARSAPIMAAEINVDPHVMYELLERHVRQHLSELAEVKFD